MKILAELSCKSKEYLDYFSSQTFQFDECSFKIDVSDFILVEILTTTKEKADLCKNFYLFFEILHLCFGYFFDIDKLIIQGSNFQEDILDKGIVIKYKSHQSVFGNYEHFICFDNNIDASCLLNKWKLMRGNSKQTIDVYYTAVSKCDLYPEVKLALIIQAMEGFCRLTIDKSKIESLSKSEARAIKKMAVSAIEQSEEIKECCAKLEMDYSEVLKALSDLMGHFNDITLRNLLRHSFNINKYTLEIENMGNSIKDKGAGINFLIRSVNHRNYFAHLTSNEVRFNGKQSLAASGLYDKFMRFMIFNQIGLSNNILEESVMSWKNNYGKWINDTINC